MATEDHGIEPIDAVGIECGGTRTTVVGTTGAGVVVRHEEFSAGNLQLLDDGQLDALLGEIAQAFESPHTVGIGMAGLRTPADRRRVESGLRRIWPSSRVYATDDLETIVEAVPVMGSGGGSRVLLVAGTGSCCWGRRGGGVPVKVGGWGHWLGDDLGAYGIGLAALRRLVRDFDGRGRPNALLNRILEFLSLDVPDALIGWIQSASKSEIGSVAPLVFDAWRRRHAIGTPVIERVIEAWIEDAASCARRLGGAKLPQFILSGGCFHHQSAFAERVAQRLRRRFPGCEVVTAGQEGARGAARLGQRLGKKRRGAPGKGLIHPGIVPESLALSPTEERNPRSMNLDELSIRDAIELMVSEDALLSEAVRDVAPSIERVVGWVARRLRDGGRLFYVGAGTSGRLGVLDASECPPTFRTDPSEVQGIIAGGRSALWRSIEGAEDSVWQGASEIERLSISSSDLVIGIAASGRTPFVWGSLVAAKAAGAKTALICFNPHLKFARGAKPDQVICPKIGPEILTGSTRLKSGTATKMILNMITTLAMVKRGKVIQNLMIDLNPSNVKLRDRAVRIVAELTGCSRQVAADALERDSWVVKKAFRRVRNEDRKSRKRN